MAVDSSNRFPEIKTHVKQVASYISFLFNTFYFNTWISSFDRWLILLTFTICTRRACRVDLYFQIGPRHKLTSETVKGHSPHMAQHGWIYHCRAARCMRQARAVPAYKTHPQLLIFAAVKKSAPYTRVFTVCPAAFSRGDGCCPGTAATLLFSRHPTAAGPILSSPHSPAIGVKALLIEEQSVSQLSG